MTRITFDEEMKKLPPARKAKIEAKTQELWPDRELIHSLIGKVENY